MDKQSEQKDSPEEKAADIKEENTENKEDVGRTVTIQIADETAGPSKAHRVLPGGISPRLIPTGRSKSEHSITQIITRQDVANALKLTSLSFGTTNPPTRITNIKDLKISALDKDDDDTNKLDTATMLDLKRFMASCFKFSKEAPPITSLPEVPVKVVSVIANDMTELPNSSCDAQTESTPIPPELNEVIVTKPSGNVETKIITRPGVDKKKITTPDKKSNLSERSDLGVSNVDSLSSIGSNVCRICMTRGRERLISPCNCKGSLANVHLSCLERWLNQVGRNHCELCGFSYPAIRTPRYTVLQALRLWFGNPRNRSHLQSDCLIFWLLSTVTAGLLAVCIVGTQYFVIEGSKFGKPDTIRKEEGISHRITETAMDFFMAVVLCGYSVTVYLLWKDHYVMWNRWRRANVNVRLLLSPDTSVPFVPRSRYNVV